MKRLYATPRYLATLVILFSLGLFATPSALAQVPQTISYQAALTDEGGDAVAKTACTN